MKEKIHPHQTTKERTNLSFPSKWILRKGLIKGSNLDFGCGFGSDIAILKSKGIKVLGYDNHYFPAYPKHKFDTIHHPLQLPAQCSATQ